MKKGLKKKLILCLVAALVIGMFSGMTIFADDNDNATLSMQGAAARPGETVEIPVSIAGNPGVIGFDLKVSYPAEKLRLQEIKKGELIETAEKDAVLGAQEILSNTPDEAAGETLTGYAGEDNAEGDGTLFTLVFTVADDAGTGEAVVSVAPGTATESAGGIYTVNDTNTNVVAIPVNQENSYAESVVLINAEAAPDRSGLENAIRTAQEELDAVSVSADGTDVYASEEWVTEADQAAFADAIKAAQAVLDQEEVTQADLDAACETLAAAQKTFDDAKQAGTKEIDKEALKNAIEAAQADADSVTVSEDGSDVGKAELWTDQESAGAFAAAIAAAQAVYEDPDATDEAVAQAIDVLKEAQKAFDDAKQNGTKEEAPDKDALFDALAEAMTAAKSVSVSADGSDIDEGASWVTQDEMDALNDAINAAKALLTDQTAEQSVIDGQTEALQAAVAAFENAKKPGTREKEDTIPISDAAVTGIQDTAYTGEAIQQNITVKVGEKALKQGTDYTVSYQNNVNVGIADVTIAGTGEYSGTITEHFRVLFKDVADPAGQFYFDSVYWASDLGVVSGWDDGTFRPLNDCNRAAVVTFLWRLADKPEPSAIADFTDMPADTEANQDFRKAISWASEKGIVTGWDDGTFRPWNKCNRAAIVTFLWRYAGEPEAETEASFTDMTGNAAFNQAISWASGKGIVTGWDDGTFRPWNTCKRLAVVSFLDRYAQ